jgi:pyruvate/2-oxoglutarate dehydrogenase complex dihydrolipoamide acyltransferase (E2) component
MNSIMRITLAAGGCTIAVAAVGCGGTTAGTPATSNPTGAAPTASAAPVSCANPQVSSAKSPVSGLALLVADLPSGGPIMAQISDGRMNNTANTDQRGFANTGNTYRIEDDVVLDVSIQAASADYPQLRDAAKGQFATVSASMQLPGLGCQADEYIGTTSNGYSQVGVAFQDGDVVAVVLLVNSKAPVDAAFALAVAQAQDHRIAASAN